MEFLTAAALTASGVVVLVQEILKLRIVPLAFANRFPVLTNIILSVVATLFMVPVDANFDNLGELLVQAGTIAVVAAISYNMLVKPSGVKELEGVNENSII